MSRQHWQCLDGLLPRRCRHQPKPVQQRSRTAGFGNCVMGNSKQLHTVVSQTIRCGENLRETLTLLSHQVVLVLQYGSVLR